MVYLRLGGSIFLEIIISLIPYLTELLLPKKPLTMNFLSIQRSASLLLALPPMQV